MAGGLDVVWLEDWMIACVKGWRGGGLIMSMGGRVVSMVGGLDVRMS